MGDTSHGPTAGRARGLKSLPWLFHGSVCPSGQSLFLSLWTEASSGLQVEVPGVPLPAALTEVTLVTA